MEQVGKKNSKMISSGCLLAMFVFFYFYFFILFFVFFVVVVAISWAALAAYGGSQARG